MRLKNSASASFTLIEVTLGLTILILIFGVIFQLVQFSVMAADEAAKSSLRSREVSGLFALVRQLCWDLPVQSQLALEQSRGGQTLSLTNAPVAIFPERFGGVRVLRLELKKAATGDGKELVLEEQFTDSATDKQKKPEVNTFRLMNEVEDLRWFVGDTTNQAKMDSPLWAKPFKPAYLKMVLVRKNGKRMATNTGIFWIPAGMSPNGQPPEDPVFGGFPASTNATTNGNTN
jgi:hypothetical protein